MECEVCGREVKKTYRVIIEGVEMNVCRECAKLGKRIDRRRVKRERKPIVELPETVLEPDFGEKIKKARELLGLSREELAKKVRASEALIEKLESQKLKPTMEMAKKLERAIGVVVIKEVKQEKPKKQEKKPAKPQERKQKPKQEKRQFMTLGDIANIVVKKSN